MISQTMEYALRAAVFLAGTPQRAQTTTQIARATRVPPAYLAKVMQQMADAELVRAQRGIGGGFTLLKRPEELSLLEVVSSVELLQRMRACPMEFAQRGTRLCALHKQLDDALATIEAAFARIKVGDILRQPAGSVPLCMLSGGLRSSVEAEERAAS